MRKDFGPKPFTYPQPVFILASYDAAGVPNAMNAAWGGIAEEDIVTVCISAGHKTTANILARKAFTISMGCASQAIACDYVGITSGNDVADKFSRAGWHATTSSFVDAPLVDELPMALECELISYDPETCTLLGRIVNVSADEAVLNPEGMVDPVKLDPIVFDPMNSTYCRLGEVVAAAFSDGSKIH